MIRYDHYTDKFVKVSDRECPWCKAVCASTDKYCHECGWHIADTPQTDCETCRHYKLACELFSEVCKYEPTTQNSNLTFETDTPQTDCDKCIWNVCNYNKVEWDADTPQTDWHYDEQDATWYPYKHEDEPQQKSCATCKHALGNWDGESNNCGRCCGTDRRFYEPKTESQTERSE